MTWVGILTIGLILLSCWKGYCNGFVREIVSMFFVILSMLIVWMINPYVNSFLKENTPIYQIVHNNGYELLHDNMDIEESELTEEQILDELSLPKILEKEILKNNTGSTYTSLAVSGFEEYVLKSIGTIVINGLSFLISYMLAMICIRTISYALNIITSIPIIKGVNKIAGAFIGGARCVIVIWLLLVVLLLLCNMEIGQKITQIIEQDYLLNMLNNNNPFLGIFMNIYYGYV